METGRTMLLVYPVGFLVGPIPVPAAINTLELGSAHAHALHVSEQRNVLPGEGKNRWFGCKPGDEDEKDAKSGGDRDCYDVAGRDGNRVQKDHERNREKDHEPCSAPILPGWREDEAIWSCRESFEVGDSRF